MLTIKDFYALSLDELYGILALRSEVFVVEQQSIYHDLDGVDQQCLHIFARDAEGICGYARVIPPGVKYDEPAFGRLVVHPRARKSGLGRKLLTAATQRIHADYPNEPVRIEAQTYLQKFYESEGFVQASDLYVLDGLPHIVMLKR